MDFKFNHFVIFATSISILLIFSLFTHKVFYNLKKEYGNIDLSFDFKPVHLDKTEQPVPQKIKPVSIQKPSKISTKKPIVDKKVEQPPIVKKTVDAPQVAQPPVDSKTAAVPQSLQKSFWNSLVNVPSILTAKSSREVTNINYTSTPATILSQSSPSTTLTNTPVQNITTTPYLTTKLPESIFLGEVKIIQPIFIGDITIIVEPTKIALTKKMKLIIENEIYVIKDVAIKTTFFFNAAYITLDRPVHVNVNKETNLKLLSPDVVIDAKLTITSSDITTTPSTTSLTTTPLSSNYSTTPSGTSTSLTTTPLSSNTTPTSVNTTTAKPSRKSYLLHLLSEGVRTNENLMFEHDNASFIVNEIKTTENFSNSNDIIEGAGPIEVVISGTDPNPTIKAPFYNQIKCDSSVKTTPNKTSSTDVYNENNYNNSILYINDCLGYPIKSAFIGNGKLLIVLNTNDDTFLSRSYYRLVI